MSSSYVPPHLRNGSPRDAKPKYTERRRDFKPQWEAEKEAAEQKKRAEEARNVENTYDNFPTLSSTLQNTRTWASSGKSFAQLASEWDVQKKKDDEAAAMEKRRIEEYETRRRSDYIHPTLPQFNNIGRHIEPEDTDTEQPEQESQDGWTFVDRRKAKKVVQVEDDKSSDSNSEKNDDTVWNSEQPEEHETCWDDKKY